MTRKGDRVTQPALRSLYERLMRRELLTAQPTFETIREALERVEPSTPFAGRRLRTLAEWADVGSVSVGALQNAVERFRDTRELESLEDFAGLKIARTIEQLLISRPSGAIESLGIVRQLAQDLQDAPFVEMELTFLHARCLGGQGKYESAADELTECAELALSRGLPGAVGFIKVVEAMMNLEAGRYGQMQKTLEHVQRLITDEDPNSKVLLHITYAKYFRRRGLLRLAPDRWALAAEAIQKCKFPQQAMLGKIKTGAALTQLRLLGCRQRQLDDKVKSIKSNVRRPILTAKDAVVRDRSECLQEIQTQLGEALAIYETPKHRHGRSTTFWALGLVALYEDRWDDAREFAIKAYEEASDHDHVGKARAKQLESQADLVSAEQEEGDSRSKHRQAAVANARKSQEHAAQTQHGRLITKSQAQLASALLFDGTPGDEGEARELLNEAGRRVPRSVGDYLWDLIVSLERRIAPPANNTMWADELVEKVVTGKVSLREAIDQFENRCIERVANETGSLSSAMSRLGFGGPKRQRKMRMLKARLSKSVRFSDPDTVAGSGKRRGV